MAWSVKPEHSIGGCPHAYPLSGNFFYRPLGTGEIAMNFAADLKVRRRKGVLFGRLCGGIWICHSRHVSLNPPAGNRGPHRVRRSFNGRDLEARHALSLAIVRDVPFETGIRYPFRVE